MKPTNVTNTDDGRISVDGKEELRSEIDALRRIVRERDERINVLLAEVRAGRKWQYYGGQGDKEAYLAAIQDTGPVSD